MFHDTSVYQGDPEYDEWADKLDAETVAAMEADDKPEFDETTKQWIEWEDLYHDLESRQWSAVEDMCYEEHEEAMKDLSDDPTLRWRNVTIDQAFATLQTACDQFFALADNKPGPMENFSTLLDMVRYAGCDLFEQAVGIDDDTRDDLQISQAVKFLQSSCPRAFVESFYGGLIILD